MKIKRFQGGYDNNFCYVLSCKETKTAAIVDPSVEINPVIEYIDSNDFILDKILITHTHYDHIRYLDDFIDLYPLAKVYASSNAQLSNLINFHELEHNDVIGLGKHLILSLFTPGHYSDSMCYWIKSKDIIFTGDTMFVGRTGRTISDGSDIKKLYNSTYNILLKLPLETTIYPGHHYGFCREISLLDNIKYSIFFQCNNFSEFNLVMKNFEKTRKL
jgi:glyoxylase-like metal-dependent hydrolase (beta-lactamase superfamily II)